MSNKITIAALLVDETTTVTWIEVCQQYGITEQDLQDMMEYGLLGETDLGVQEAVVDAKNLKRIASACRLQQDLGLNLPGVILVLELLDELEYVRNELAILQRLTE